MERVGTLDVARSAGRALKGVILACLLLVPSRPQAEELSLSARSEAAVEGETSYETAVEQGVALARSGRSEEAERELSRAVRMRPERAEARREKGALFFREKRYRDAARELGAAVRRSDDMETRRLWGAALHLSGQMKAALRAWNTIEEPQLREIHFSGLKRTRPPLVRGEIPLIEGKLLSLGRLEETELRLHDLGAFDRVSVRTVPWGDGTADLDVALIERHGLAGSRLEFAAQTVGQLVAEKIELRYANLQGWGLTLRGRYRWQHAQPDLSLACDWPRPFGADVKASARVFRGRQQFDVEQGIERRGRGFDLDLQHVIDGRTMAQAGLGYRERVFQGARELAAPGDFLRFRLGLTRRVISSRHLDMSIDGSMVQNSGREISCRQGIVSLEGGVRLQDHGGLPPTRVAFQFRLGASSEGTPFDELFIPGGGADAEWPMRAHRRAYGGVIGRTPLAQHILLGNIELRHWMIDTKIARMGIALAYSPAVLSGPTVPGNGKRQFQDVGIGLRIAGLAGMNFRMDVGFGLLDGTKAVFLGWNEWF
ncbi:MAG: hypothetical protein JXO72_11315 [Vicinamibacteria bacterium]|nr:hypothetical protein [Vicinamibacteria bacterium]